ncbi:virulence RhuM family protein [Moraxella nasovis]|uniref:virulence RhuM family protein n=1 Tax=Moraxella nasovis TaxID=2904121 RepID=UPI001F602FA8|nr:virulence RhuM family protein [Moraxella nasovis]UNU72555.1 virulence RhuM family protein [Moraxella nasovis]
MLYTTDDGKAQFALQQFDEQLWLNQMQIAELYQTSKQNISKHINAIFAEGEIDQNSTVNSKLIVQTEGKRQIKRTVKYYSLPLIIAIGYRVRSARGTQFRQWATERLHEYVVKGFTLDDERLKNLSGGNYFKELLGRIREIRSSEKVMYRQVLDLYATAMDYDPKSETSITFFKIIQNKLHFAAHGHTASEVIYFRVDSDKPYAGLTTFKGAEPTQADAMVAKNYLNEQELRVLNNLVSAYFDFAELNAIEERPMMMADYVNELDRILQSTGRKVLDNAGTISRNQAIEKAKSEYKKYKAKTLSEVEKSYLQTIQTLNTLAKQKGKG